MAHTLVNMIDRAWEDREAQEDPFRAHLGGSMIGKTCERELVYSFRWTLKVPFKGRMLRLFNRGHKEEFRFVEFLRMVGINVREYSQQLWYHPDSDSYIVEDWGADLSQGEGDLVDMTDSEFHIKRAEAKGVKLKQWRISDIMSHFGGSLDGLADAPFDIPVDGNLSIDELEKYPDPRKIPAGEEFLLEFKTHNTRSFCKLVAEGVRKAKPVHWAQMQIYMHKRGLRFAVYVAVNKNDDDLHVEVVEYDPQEGPKLLERAERVIKARTLPPRVGSHESWHECKFCDYKAQCHRGAPLLKNCRSCRHSAAVEDGKWRCDKWNAIIPVDAILAGCDNWSPITD